jgi:hypothetical protein
MVIEDNKKILQKIENLRSFKSLPRLTDQYSVIQCYHTLSTGIWSTLEFVQGQEATKHGRPAIMFGRAAA